MVMLLRRLNSPQKVLSGLLVCLLHGELPQHEDDKNGLEIFAGLADSVFLGGCPVNYCYQGVKMSDKLITPAKVLCVIVGISFSLMLVALFLSLAWVMLSSSGLLG